MKKAAEESEHVRTEQQEASKASYDELVVKHTPLADACKNLEGVIQLKSRKYTH